MALSAGVQQMVRSDIGASGVMFTMDTESGFADAVFITSSYGLGEAVVQGAVNPDEFYVYKPALRAGRPAILKRGIGGKAIKMIYTDDAEVGKTTEFVDVEEAERGRAQPDRRRGRPSWLGTRWPSRTTTAGRWTSSGARTVATVISTSCRPARRRCSPGAAPAVEQRYRLTENGQRVDRGARHRSEDRCRRRPGALARLPR